jgi:uncharacterized protein with ATP-grasp and redox domains
METNTKAIFFLLMAKCDPIAQLLGVNKGDMIAKFNQIEQ